MDVRNAPVAGGPDGELSDDEAFSLIDRHTTVDGTLASERDLRVDGNVLGTLQCGGVLFIADGAEVDATVEAGAIVVSGTLSGNIVCHGRLEIRPSGVVRGNVQTGSLVIQEGALYEGQLRMQAPEPAPAAPDEPEPAPESEAEPEPAPLAPDEQPNAYSFLRRFTTAAPHDADNGPRDDLPASAEPEREGR
jgi:cytoskeletal protein CcmA (bactofilin family)